MAYISQQMSNNNKRVNFLELKVCEHHTKHTEIEASKAYDTQMCDEIRSKQITTDT